MKTSKTISHEAYQKIHQAWLKGLEVKRQNERFYQGFKTAHEPYARILYVGSFHY